MPIDRATLEARAKDVDARLAQGRQQLGQLNQQQTQLIGLINALEGQAIMLKELLGSNGGPPESRPTTRAERRRLQAAGGPA